MIGYVITSLQTLTRSISLNATDVLSVYLWYKNHWRLSCWIVYRHLQLHRNFILFLSYRKSDANDESGSSGRTGKRQLKLTNIGFTTLKRKSEDIESNAKGRCKFFQARKLEQLSHF